MSSINVNRAARPCRVFAPLLLAAAGAITGTAAFGADAAAPPHWSYSGETGPAHWGAEDPSYSACGIGKSQSPVDIKATVKKDLPEIQFDYKPTALKVTDTGHSMQVNYDAGSGITIDGERYELVQFHFHEPSEEHVHGRAYSMTTHLVHKNAKGELAVVTVLLKQGKTNAFLKPVFDNFPAKGTTESSVAGATINIADYLPSSHGYYTFDGSLTTPPCSEHVRWLVLKTPVELSAAQIGQFKARYSHNNRPVQPLNGRVILESKN